MRNLNHEYSVTDKLAYEATNKSRWISESISSVIYSMDPDSHSRAGPVHTMCLIVDNAGHEVSGINESIVKKAIKAVQYRGDI